MNDLGAEFGRRLAELLADVPDDVLVEIKRLHDDISEFAFACLAADQGVPCCLDYLLDARLGRQT